MGTVRRFGLYSGTWMGAGKTDRRIFLLVMLLHLAFITWYNTWQSPACDESSYFSYAVRWAKGQTERTGILDDSKTPIVLPATWSLALRHFHSPGENINGELNLMYGRLAMYGYFYLLSLGFFCWSYRLFGPLKWALPWLLFLADPLLISNAMIVGSDMASACCMFWAFYLAWRFSITRNMRYWWLFCIVCGVALLVKISMAVIIPMVAILLWMAGTVAKNNLPPETTGKKVFRWVSLFAICLLLINAGYQFSHTGLALKNYPAQSTQLKAIQQQFPVLASIPLPVPQPYLSSYDLLLRNAGMGGGHTEAHSYHGVYLNGVYKSHGGFWNYYLWQFLYKTTPLLLLTLAGGFIFLFIKRHRLVIILKTWAFVWLPPLGFLVWLSIANPFQIGIRHALPAWPFLYLLAGSSIVFFAKKMPRVWVLLMVFQFAEIAWFFPNLTAYSPVWMQPKQTLYRRFYDSSLSYCNDALIYRHFLLTHPEYKVPPPVPAAGKYALRLVECNNIIPKNGLLSCWLLQHFTPAGHYKSTILLFEISEQDLSTIVSQ